MSARTAELPLLAVLAVVGAGLVGSGLLHAWRAGAVVVGLGLLLGGALRLTLPTRQAGLLAVRGRAVDATVLLALGFALVLLANTIPAA